MNRRESSLLPIPVEPELKILILDAAERTRLSQADVMRSALRIGVPELVKRLQVSERPRRDLMEYVDAFRGIVHLGRDHVQPSRFK